MAILSYNVVVVGSLNIDYTRNYFQGKTGIGGPTTRDTNTVHKGNYRRNSRKFFKPSAERFLLQSRIEIEAGTNYQYSHLNVKIWYKSKPKVSTGALSLYLIILICE